MNIEIDGLLGQINKKKRKKMKTRLLKRLRKEYSGEYTLVRHYKHWEVVYRGNYTFTPKFETREEALEYVRDFVNEEIQRYINRNKIDDKITSKMLYG